MRCILTNRTIGMKSFSIGTNRINLITTNTNGVYLWVLENPLYKIREYPPHPLTPPPPPHRAKNELPIMSLTAYTSETKKDDAGAEFLFYSINQSLFWKAPCCLGSGVGWGRAASCLDTTTLVLHGDAWL